jgi:hypothetical protein
MFQWKMDNIFSFVILDVPPGPGFISTSPDNNNKLMRSKLKEITEYIDLNLVNAVLHKACTYNINQCKISYKLKDTISLTQFPYFCLHKILSIQDRWKKFPLHLVFICIFFPLCFSHHGLTFII